MEAMCARGDCGECVQNGADSKYWEARASPPGWNGLLASSVSSTVHLDTLGLLGLVHLSVMKALGVYIALATLAVLAVADPQVYGTYPSDPLSCSGTVKTCSGHTACFSSYSVATCCGGCDTVNLRCGGCRSGYTCVGRNCASIWLIGASILALF